ncbi:BrnA antitoxin family protein [Limnohabitans sp. Rim8]|uniref:BrnA antitoxin family protein n=1 Tax=Limnohabitans sp. Rim8 TaxID=1100718 RepID=UPI0026029EDE|nr:BrnA antitoxin family protein [Limnohabitans sp. Rim8]
MSKKPNPELIDDENPEWTAADFAKARPASEVLPQIFGAKLAQEMLKPRGRPRAEHPKERINIRLSHEVVEYFKSAGDGWQTRIDSALRQFITERQGR